MITRAVSIIFKNGLCTRLTLPPFEGSEIESTAEFINKIKIYKDAIERFMVRNPNLSIGSKKKSVDNLTDFFHVLLNARKYVDLIGCSSDVDQEFDLNFVSGSFSVHKVPTKETLGTMYFNAMYDNWRELFYPSSFGDAISSDGITVTTSGILTTVSPSSSVEAPKEFNAAEDLSSAQLTLYSVLFKMRKYSGKFILEYSGCGDSGSIDRMSVDTTTTSLDLSDDAEIDRLVWNVIDEAEPGFYNNDGGYGHMQITPDGFKWEHFNYITDTDQSVDQHYGDVTTPDLSSEEEEEEDTDDWEEDEPHEDPTDYKDAMYDKHADEPSPELPF